MNHQHHRWRPQKSLTQYQDCWDAQDKQQMQYPLIPRSKSKMHRRYWEFPNRNVQILCYVYQSTNGQNHGQNHGPVWKTQSFLLNEICTVILWQGCYGKGNLRKSYWHTVGKRFPNWECLFVNTETGLFLSVYVDNLKLVGKKQSINPTWKILNKEVDLGETTSFLDHVYFGCAQRQRCCRQLQSHLWIANFSGKNRKTTILSKSWYFFMVLWYGWSCKEMCGAILWVSKQDDSTTLQSIYSMHRWPSLQRRRNESCWRIVTSMLSNCSEMLIFGKNWKTWYSMVSEQTRTIHHKMDQNLWQTPESIDILHPSHMWIQTVLFWV